MLHRPNWRFEVYLQTIERHVPIIAAFPLIGSPQSNYRFIPTPAIVVEL